MEEIDLQEVVNKLCEEPLGKALYEKSLYAKVIELQQKELASLQEKINESETKV